MKTGLGCVGLLVVMAAAAGGVDQLTNADLPSPLRFFVAAAAGVLLTLGVSNFWMLLRGYGQGDASRAAVLARARTGEPPPQDGPIVITGVVRADADTLRGPISGVECVAYQYRLYTIQGHTAKTRREVPIYWGYASRPFRVDSPRQAFRVMAVPQLADDPTPHESSESRARAKAYVAATRYEQKHQFPGIAATAVEMFRELVREPAGDVRHDWQLADVNLDIDKLLIEETVVPAGATVSVSGQWSAERRAIVPPESAGMVTLQTGSAEDLARHGSAEVPWSVMSVAVTGTLLCLVGTALVWFSRTGQIADWWRRATY